jgi:hypothetical protein
MTDCWFRRVELSRRGSVDDRVLRIDLVPAPLAEAAPPAIFERIGEDLGRIAAIKADEHPQSGERALLLEALVAAVALRSALSSIDTTEPFTIDGLIENGRLAPEAAPLFGFLMRLLERFDAAEESEREWRLITDHELPSLPRSGGCCWPKRPTWLPSSRCLPPLPRSCRNCSGTVCGRTKWRRCRWWSICYTPRLSARRASISFAKRWTGSRHAGRKGGPCAYSNWRQAAAPAGGSSIGWRNPA